MIMTSNIRNADDLREFFRPEFLNRIDEMCSSARSPRQIAEIVELQVGRLRSCWPIAGSSSS